MLNDVNSFIAMSEWYQNCCHNDTNIRNTSGACARLVLTLGPLLERVRD